MIEMLREYYRAYRLKSGYLKEHERKAVFRDKFEEVFESIKNKRR